MKLSLKLMIVASLCVLNLSAGRAQRQYPGSASLPDDVMWMREIYRTLDLTKDANGALYYPVEPQGNRMNLFTTLFRLLAQKKIPAYEYQLDGTERFQKDAEITFRDVLDRFQIYYELKKVANRRGRRAELFRQGSLVLRPAHFEVWFGDNCHLPGAAPFGRVQFGEGEAAHVLGELQGSGSLSDAVQGGCEQL